MAGARSVHRSREDHLRRGQLARRGGARGYGEPGRRDGADPHLGYLHISLAGRKRQGHGDHPKARRPQPDDIRILVNRQTYNRSFKRRVGSSQVLRVNTPRQMGSEVRY